MSSHHFVKEGQEPALFILDPVDFELAGPFLEWAPLVMVSEYALDEVLLWGIKIDGALMPEGDDATEEKLGAQAPIEIIRLHPGASLIKQVFDYLIKKKQTGVNVLTARPEIVFADAEMVAKQLHVSIVDNTTRWVGISTGRFEKWLTMNTPIVIRKSHQNQSMTIRGLNEKNGHFECANEGVISVVSDHFFWIAEPHA